MPKKNPIDRILEGKASTAAHKAFADEWFEKILSAQSSKSGWEGQYNPDVLEDYYCGFQWDPDAEDNLPGVDHMPRVVNLFFPSIEIIKPSLFFHNPRFKVTPRPSRLDDPLTNVEARAKLQEDTLNTFVSDPEFGFEEAIEMALFEAFFRFGVIEIGYTADPVDNPRAGKPVMKKDVGGDSPMLSSSGKPLMEPERLLENEKLFLARIPAKNFLMPSDSKPKTEDNEWCGYSEWHRIDEIKANKSFQNTGDLTATGKIWDQYKEEADDDDESKKGQMIKIWKIWSQRLRRKFYLAEGYGRVLKVEKFDKLPFGFIRFHKTTRSWYPVPPTFNWLFPQQELNETRAQQTEYRERMIPKWLADRAVMDDPALQQLESREMGSIATVDGLHRDAIVPVPIPAPNVAMLRAAPEAKEDFREISGITGEQRGLADAETATQANLLEQRARIRENFRRSQVGHWLSKLGQLTLTLLEERMTLDFWVKTNVDLASPLALGEIESLAGTWQQIKSDRLGPMSFDVSVDLASLSPVAEEQARQNWNQVLLLISNPQLLAMLSQSEVLLRRTLENYGIVNEKDIQEVKRVAGIVAQQLGLPGGQDGQQKSGLGLGGASAVPGQEEIIQQLANQGGLGGVIQ